MKLLKSSKCLLFLIRLSNYYNEALFLQWLRHHSDVQRYPLPQRRQICENNFLKPLIGLQPIKERRFLIKHGINLDNARNSLRKICPI